MKSVKTGLGSDSGDRRQILEYRERLYAVLWSCREGAARAPGGLERMLAVERWRWSLLIL